MDSGILSYPQSEKNEQIISYFTLRILIGAAGISLPFLLVIAKLITVHSLQLEYSISDYYGKGTSGSILVGVLFALGFFLFSYKGYERIDNWIARLGCFFALGVALFPTNLCEKCWVHQLHFIFAFLLFSDFIFFSVYLFRKSDKKKKKTQQKKNRDRVYLICGIIMITCIVCIAISNFFLDKWSIQYHLVFWFESLALVSFGFSWIVKAELLFWKDKKLMDEKIL